MRIFKECDSPKLLRPRETTNGVFRSWDSAMEKVDIAAEPVANGVLNIGD